MEAEFQAVRVSSAPSSASSTSSSPASSSASPSQISIIIRKAKADTADSSSIAPPFTTSSSSSAFSPSPLLNPSPFTRAVRFAEHFSSSPSSRAESVAPYPVISDTHTKPFIITSSSTITSSVSSPIPSLSYPETSASSPHHTSPTSSAFVSASASPFISPPAHPSTGGSTPIGVSSPPTGQSTSPEETVTFRPNPTPALAYTPSFYRSSSSSRFSAPQTLDHASLNVSSGASFVKTSVLPPRAVHATVDLPSSSTCARSCDVYIGTHGVCPSLSRFSKWLRAELELQGIACFLADRARYSDVRSHDIALRTINSCTFGVVIITKKTFKNLYSMQEIHTFLNRKNLVPLFFDVAPSDCLARDIVERRGAVWEKDGGELWRLFDSEEREWTEALDGLSRVEEWKLEAYNGKWRDCILKAVTLLGTRLGRRSVVERERARKERVDSEEFPFPRNTRFVGRERELRALENLLFASNEDLEGEETAEIGIKNGCSRLHMRIADRPPRGYKQFARDGYAARRWSDADRWQRIHVADRDFRSISGRRKSDSDRWHTNIGRDEAGLLCSRTNSEASSSRNARQQDFENSWDTTTSAEASFLRGRAFQKFKDENRSNRHSHRTARHRQAQASKELQSNTDVESSLIRARGVACVTGAAGIGKTELVLEYAHRFSQRYRMVLWVGGEARYQRQNYLNLSLFLGLDVGTESQVGPERGRVRTFDEQEMEAFQRVKRELQRDVPYLLIIDNVESYRDWWDGRELSELIPQEGATHVILTTRLSTVMNMEPLELSYLSGMEALSLMKGKRGFPSQELDALKDIEEKLERLTFGLGMVGTLLSKLPIMPTELLGKMEKVELREWQWASREEATLKNNPFLVKLLGVCFSYVDQISSTKGFPLKMVLVGGWFGPYPIPLSLLALAASIYPEKSQGLKLFNAACFSFCAATRAKKWEEEASSLLVNYGIARKCSRQGWIHFHEIVQLYSRKRGGVQAAKAMVQSMRKRGSVLLHSEHLWAACFLVLGFGNDPVVVELKLVELLSFIRRGVLQLAVRSFTWFSRCHAALELLRLSANMLEDVEKLFVSQIHNRWDKSLCCKERGYAGQQVNEYVWQDVTLLKALVLETRAKLMLKGGQFDAGEEICRTCISIRMVMLGQDHPDTICAQETLAKLVRCRSNA